jgi:hypothetical protein
MYFAVLPDATRDGMGYRKLRTARRTVDRLERDIPTRAVSVAGGIVAGFSSGSFAFSFDLFVLKRWRPKLPTSGKRRAL